MSKTYEQASAEIRDLIDEVMMDLHPVLAACDVRVDALIVKELAGETVLPALRHNGYAAAATIKPVSLKQRALGQGDALMTIDLCAWNSFDDSKKRALIDHELTHLQVQRTGRGLCSFEKGDLVGEPKLDDLERPKLKLRRHDWQLGGFFEIVERHGQNAPEVQAIEACRDYKTGQYYWNFDRILEKVA